MVIINLEGNRDKKLYQDNELDQYHGDMQPIIQPSEMAETFKTMDNDELNKEGFSSIDVNSRLDPIQIPAMVSWDFLIVFPN